MTDLINRPAHYTRHKIECVEVSERLSSALAQAWQYLWRADEKGMAALDRGKAIWWLRRERRRLVGSHTASAACDESPPHRLAAVIAPFDPMTSEALSCIWRLAWDDAPADDMIDLAIRLVEMRMAEAARAPA